MVAMEVRSETAISFSRMESLSTIVDATVPGEELIESSHHFILAR